MTAELLASLALAGERFGVAVLLPWQPLSLFQSRHNWFSFRLS